MAIKDLYFELNNKPFSKETLNAYIDLRNDALLANNSEYYYLCGIKIADIYLEFGLANNAIEILNKDLEKIDPSTFKNIYVGCLERIIYAYIKKGNFKLAYKYISEKRKYIDNLDHEKVNRWYIEMAYVYGEMGQASKALSCLNAVKENLPDDEMLSYTLSNITKIYIDQNMISEAKSSLQEALRVTTDSDGIKYCNYLLAKILLLEDNFDQASELLDGIFDLEVIEEDYLGIANEYISELLKHKELNKAKELLKKASRDVARCNDDRIKKYYLLNKVKYIALSLELNNIVDIVSEIDKLEKNINNNDSSNMLEALEDEKDYEVNARLSSFVNTLEKINLLNAFPFNEYDLRDNIFNFLNKLEEIISFEQVNISMFDKPNRLGFISNNNGFTNYDYHKQRLYEKNLDYSNITNSVLEKLISSNDVISYNLKDVNLPMIDFISGKSLQDENVAYLLAIPYFIDNSLSFSFIYYTKFLDVTTLENEIILKLASTILFNKINSHIKLEDERFDLTINNYLDNASYSSFHYQNLLYVNRNLAALLGINSNGRYTILDIHEYNNIITNNSNIDYLSIFNGSDKVNISYGLKIKNKVVVVKENANLVMYHNYKTYYSIITLDSLSEEIKTNEDIVSDQVMFYEYINSLKPRTKDIEFKFSFVRFNSFDSEADTKAKVASVTGVKAYHLDDGTYAFILENEVNQRSLDRIVNMIGYNSGIVRFPRDLVDLDDIVSFSKICLDSNELYFSDDVYQAYLNKQTVSKVVNDVINTNLEFVFLRLGTYLDNRSFEVRLNIPGVSLDQDVRKIIDKEALHKYELKLLETFKPVKNTDLYYLCVSFDALEDYINNSESVRIYQNVIYVVDEYDEKYYELIRTFKKQHINYILEYKVLDKLPTNAFLDGYVSGIAIFEGLEQAYRHSLIEFVTNLGLPIYANYQFLDYDRCIYRKEEFVSLEDISDAK